MPAKRRHASFSSRRNERRRLRGATLIETALAFSVLGCLLAAFLPTFVRNAHLSKSSEAVRTLERMHQGAAAYFAATHGDALQHCLPGVAGPIPNEPSAEPREVDFANDPTFANLGFTDEIEEVRYAYWFEPYEVGCGIEPSTDEEYVLGLRAEGDLDDDRQRSTFERRDRITADHSLVPTGILYVRERSE